MEERLILYQPIIYFNILKCTKRFSLIVLRVNGRVDVPQYQETYENETYFSANWLQMRAIKQMYATNNPRR